MATPATDQGGMCQHPVTSNIKYEKDLKDQEIRGVQVAEEHQEASSRTPAVHSKKWFVFAFDSLDYCIQAASYVITYHMPSMLYPG